MIFAAFLFLALQVLIIWGSFYLGCLIGKYLFIPGVMIALCCWGALQVKHWFELPGFGGEPARPSPQEEVLKLERDNAAARDSLPAAQLKARQHLWGEDYQEPGAEKANPEVLIKGFIPYNGLLPKDAHEGDCWFVHCNGVDPTFGFFYVRNGTRWHVINATPENALTKIAWSL